MSEKNTLSEEHQQQFDYIEKEIRQFIDDELFHQGIERLDVILSSMGESEEYRLLRGAILSRRAELLLELEDDEGAWQAAQKAMNMGWYDATVHSIAGWAMFHMDELDVAQQQFDQALELDPERIPALTGRAMAHMELEEWDSAHNDLSRAIQLDPENPSSYAFRAEVEVFMGTLESARRDVEKARNLSPDDPDYALMHARLLTVAGEVDMALEAIDAAIDEEDAALEALLLRSHLKVMRGDAAAAKKDAMRASNAYPDEAFAFVQLAQVQLAGGNAALALKAAERAAKLDPSLPDAYIARGAALQLKGEAEKASEDFDRVQGEPIELPMFLLGATYDAVDASGFTNQILEMLNAGGGAPANDDKGAAGPAAAAGAGGAANPFAGLSGGIPGLGINPMSMLDQIFDDDGNIRPTFKPILKMAMKNAPSLLKTVPPGMLDNTGIDPSMLDGVDPDDISEEQLEAQMRLFYKMVKNGQNPLDFVQDPNQKPEE